MGMRLLKGQKRRGWTEAEEVSQLAKELPTAEPLSRSKKLVLK